VTGRSVQSNLWWFTAAPLIWVAHFVLSYGTASIYCAKAAEPGDLGPVRVIIAALSALALGALAVVVRRELKRAPLGDASALSSFGLPSDRAQFLAFATLLLSGLAAVGVVFVAMPAVFFETCR